MAKKVKSIGVMILAAGQGTRMKSDLPKVLHEIGGQPILFHILDRVKEALSDVSVGLVVGHRKDLVVKAIKSSKKYASLEVHFIEQKVQNGTGDAARVAMESEWGQKMSQTKSPILVLPGDFPLISRELIEQTSEGLGRSVVMRLLTCVLDDPTSYGRVVRRGKKGHVLRVVEEKDSKPREKEINEVNTAIYFFNPSFLKAGLKKLSNKNAQSEYYLPDLVAQASSAKKEIDVLIWENSSELRGINNRWELSLAGKTLNERTIRDWATRGVTFVDPSSAIISSDVVLGEGVMIHPGVELHGETVIGRNSIIESRSVLRNMKIDENVLIRVGCVMEDSVVRKGAKLGPYAHLRPGSEVGEEAKIGNFVELKKSRVGSKTSVAHLSYLGDADVGSGVNIGCGFVTCNFDGRVINGKRKHQTIIEDDVFVGSDCQTIAPVRLGRGSYVASGSTITEDVESEALAIARSRQVTKPGYARKLKGEEDSSLETPPSSVTKSIE